MDYIKLVDDTLYEVSNAAGGGGAFNATIPLADRAAFVTFVDNLTATNVATIRVYNETHQLIGQHSNLTLSTVQLKVVNNYDEETATETEVLSAYIELGQTDRLVQRVAALEDTTEVLTEAILGTEG